MKILIIHQHFRTPEQGGCIRSFHIAKGLSEAGHEVVVLTSDNNSVSHTKTPGAFRIYGLRVNYDNSFGFSRRMAAFAAFIVKAILSIRAYRQFDLFYIMSTPLSVGIIGLWARKFLKIPFVFEVGDLWPDIPIQMGIVSNPIFCRIVLRLEKMIYSRAVFVVALSEEMKELLHTKNKNLDVLVIENFSDLEYFGDLSPLQDDESFSWIPKGNFVISYIGTLGIANKVASFIHLANLLREAPVTFIIKGRGKELDLCRQLADKLNLTNLNLLPFGPRDEVKELLKITDAIYVCFDRHYPLLFTGCPNKLADGLAAGKIIFLNYSGWQGQLVLENDCGLIIDDENPEFCKSDVLKIINDEAMQQQMKINSRLLAGRFEPKLLIQRLNNEIIRTITYRSGL